MDRQLLESQDGHSSPPICSPPRFQNDQSNNNLSFTASGIDQVGERIDSAKSALSSAFCDNKGVYSSVCPTGRISFKLYDWNPAEFPRRLRHQIFEWLASMPVELEGYIRPGCTILTMFIAMPPFMWGKLHQDVALYVKDLVNAPESLFLGRANFLIYVNNWIVHILKDGTLLMNVKLKAKAPRLHYVYPTYFEAGKPIEFVACGSNLDQPKFRFLVSFSGEYLICDSCHAISHGKISIYDLNGGDSEHEMFRINISQTDPKKFGPAFIEVENESGLSNFVAVLFGNKHMCSELERLQEAFCGSPTASSIMSQISVNGVSPGLCKLLVSKQTTISELLLDIAWLLKEPQLDKKEFVMSSTNVQRLTNLIKFSMQNGFVSALDVIQCYFDNLTHWVGLDKQVNMTSDIDLVLLLKNMSHAREILNQSSSHNVQSELDSIELVHQVLMPQVYVKSKMLCTMPCKNQDFGRRSIDDLVSTRTSASQVNEENIPLVTREVARRNYCYPPLAGWSQESRSGMPSPPKAAGTRFAVVVMVCVVVVCFGACVVLLHPHKAAGEFAVSVRRCLFGGPSA